jgi:hypothetical protein
MNKIRGNKPIRVITHIYMEISPGNPLNGYLYLKQANMSFFFFFCFSLFFCKIREQGGTSPA